MAIFSPIRAASGPPTKLVGPIPKGNPTVISIFYWGRYVGGGNAGWSYAISHNTPNGSYANGWGICHYNHTAVNLALVACSDGNSGSTAFFDSGLSPPVVLDEWAPTGVILEMVAGTSVVTLWYRGSRYQKNSGPRWGPAVGTTPILLYCAYLSAPTEGYDGCLQDVTVWWGTKLTDGEMMEMQRGRSPLTVQTPTYHWGLRGGDLRDTITGEALLLVPGLNPHVYFPDRTIVAPVRRTYFDFGASAASPVPRYYRRR